jgi:hypothetical protein
MRTCRRRPTRPLQEERATQEAEMPHYIFELQISVNKGLLITVSNLLVGFLDSLWVNRSG